MNSGSVEPLITFIEAAVRLPRNKLNLNIPYMAIIKLFGKNDYGGYKGGGGALISSFLDNKNDIDGLLQFIDKLKENDVIVSRKITELINALLKRNKRL